MPNWVKNLESLNEMLSMIIVYAPDFPEEDYLAPEEQLTLRSAFDEVRRGLRFHPLLPPGGEARAMAEEALQQATSEFLSGDEKNARRRLEDLRRGLFDEDR